MGSAWVEFVKSHWKKVGGSYKAAMKSAGPLWRKSKKGGKGKDAEEGKKKVRRK